MSKNEIYRHIIDNAPDAIWVCDKNLNFTYVNPAIETTSGYTCEEKIAQGPSSTMTTKSATGLKTLINEKLSTIEPDKNGAITTGKYQCELLHKDGSTYFVESHMTFIHDDGGQVSEIIGIDRDITERINTVNLVSAYHNSTHPSVGSTFFVDLLKFLCQTIKIRYAFIAKLNGKYLCTESLCSDGSIAENINYLLEGSPCEEVVNGKSLFISNHLSELFPRATVFAEMNIQSYAGSPIQSKEGETHGILVLMDDKTMTASPLIQHLLEICSDRVGSELARLAAERKLKDSEEKFHSLFEYSLDPCIISNYAGHYIDANAATLEIFGYTHEELHDINVHDLLQPTPSVDSTIEKLHRSLLNDGVVNFHGIFKKKSGKCFPGKATSCLISLGTTKIVQTHIHDLSEVRDAEDELLKLSRAMDASATIVIITDLEGMIEYVNPKFTQVTGYTKVEVIGKSPRLLKSGETNTSVYRDLWAIISAGGEWKGELHNLKKDGSFYWCRNSISAVKNHLNEITHYISVQEDITHEYQLNAQLNYQASHDALTGLINRPEFERRAKRLLSRVLTDNNEHALCFMDLDQFKVVNDTCGHIAGDELLRQLGGILQKTVRHSDTLARIGGDEFAVLMEFCPLNHAERVATALQTAVQNHHFNWEGHTFRVSASIGLVPINNTTVDLSTLLSRADSACYMAKDKGRNRIHIFHPEDREIAQRQGEMQWITRIYRALEEDRFCLFAQTIEPLINSASKHYEILIRMKDDNGQIIPPGAFLPAAERYNIITQIDRWVTEECCRLLVAHPDFLEKINFISINLSGQSLTDKPFLDFVIAQLQQPGIDCEKICFEITETAAIANLTHAMKFISTLKGLGCKFALDDFGSGLSSFAYLKNLPVDYLKIDGMFVKGLVDDPVDHAMVKSINEIGQIMGMKTIAEFVENDEIKGMLREIGVNYVQGYGIGKPQSFDLLLNKPDSFN